MDTTLNFTVQPTGSMSGSIDLPAIPKPKPKPPWFTLSLVLHCAAGALVLSVLALAAHAVWRWVS